ncbi:YhfX family PLP-dependent enzyme [Paenibacillus sp. J5C_2022]|uniref:YhfX family PLP-dependent enzyme n=1 Tax=Paenibacillus sp. J5C2022 TaxID=2977129 RepID=UPI0021CEF584|nr:YhfX family PLP-dependent enzyme [Paenibacillus sp. J5C2022]MCU6710540.1 YhfX family PLP-dependent enzyme [Paenibacillus sp. J5C2022]
MFLTTTVERNSALVRYAIELHQSGLIMPDTYVIDLDTVKRNARMMLDEANRQGVKLLFMTKQFGRNPIVANALLELGYEGAVAVDFREAETLHQAGIPIAHVGHLVQTPTRMVGKVAMMNPDVMTVYSVDKAREIDEACRKLRRKQALLLRVVDDQDMLYPGQHGGIPLRELAATLKQLLRLQHVEVAGFTSFPCFLYDPEAGDIAPTPNVETMRKAKRIAEEQFGLRITHMNMPSATCIHSLNMIKALGGTHGEPGHGLLGSTPMHADRELAELPAMLYVSEVSHHWGDKSYCYGGGYYQRSAIEHALVADSDGERMCALQPPSPHAIDYYFELDGKQRIGSTVVMAFRTQIFVTRSQVAVVEGLSASRPRLIGVHDSGGKPIQYPTYTKE